MTEAEQIAQAKAKWTPDPAALTLRRIKRDAVIAAMQRNRGNKIRASIELGISIRCIRNLVNKSDIKNMDFRGGK